MTWWSFPLLKFSICRKAEMTCLQSSKISQRGFFELSSIFCHVFRLYSQLIIRFSPFFFKYYWRGKEGCVSKVSHCGVCYQSSQVWLACFFRPLSGCFLIPMCILSSKALKRWIRWIWSHPCASLEVSLGSSYCPVHIFRYQVLSSRLPWDWRSCRST